MNISPVSIVSPNSRSSVSSKNFNGASSVENQHVSPENSGRDIAMIGSACLSTASGLLAGGLTSCLVDGKAKPVGIGALVALIIGAASWPGKNAQ